MYHDTCGLIANVTLTNDNMLTCSRVNLDVVLIVPFDGSNCVNCEYVIVGIVNGV